MRKVFYYIKNNGFNEQVMILSRMVLEQSLYFDYIFNPQSKKEKSKRAEIIYVY